MDYAAEFFSLFGTAFNAVFRWFSITMGKAGFTGYWLAAIFTFQVYRFFLSPLLGSLGSDNVRNFKKRSK